MEGDSLLLFSEWGVGIQAGRDVTFNFNHVDPENPKELCSEPVALSERGALAFARETRLRR